MVFEYRQSDCETWPIWRCIGRNPRRLYIHLAFTCSVGPSSIVWSELGPAMRVLEVQWSWALNLVCEVTLWSEGKIVSYLIVRSFHWVVWTMGRKLHLQVKMNRHADSWMQHSPSHISLTCLIFIKQEHTEYIVQHATLVSVMYYIIHMSPCYRLQQGVHIYLRYCSCDSTIAWGSLNKLRSRVPCIQ